MVLYILGNMWKIYQMLPLSIGKIIDRTSFVQSLKGQAEILLMGLDRFGLVWTIWSYDRGKITYTKKTTNILIIHIHKKCIQRRTMSP